MSHQGLHKSGQTNLFWEYFQGFWDLLRVLCPFKGLCHHPANAHGCDSPMTVGSRSTKTALGTCLPAPVSEKKVLNESSPPPMVLSDGIWPSGWMPCSKQYNSQQALPIYLVVEKKHLLHLVVSSGHSHVFYVVFVSLKLIPTIPPHCTYVINIIRKTSICNGVKP